MPGIAQLSVEYTKTNGDKDTYRIVVYPESGGWHDDIQNLLNEG